MGDQTVCHGRWPRTCTATHQPASTCILQVITSRSSTSANRSIYQRPLHLQVWARGNAACVQRMQNISDERNRLEQNQLSGPPSVPLVSPRHAEGIPAQARASVIGPYLLPRDSRTFISQTAVGPCPTRLKARHSPACKSALQTPPASQLCAPLGSSVTPAPGLLATLDVANVLRHRSPSACPVLAAATSITVPAPTVTPR
jgi:hypothetical protein